MPNGSFFPEESPDSIKENTDLSKSNSETEERTQVVKRSIPFHPILFALFPHTALYVHNIEQVPIWQLLRPLAYDGLGVAAVFLVLALVTRRLQKSAIAASALALVFLSYGHLANLAPPAMKILAGPVCVAALAALFVALIRTKKLLLDATSVLNFASIVLLIPSIWSIGVVLARPPQTKPHLDIAETKRGSQASLEGAKVATKKRKHVSAASLKNLPDIYYIILDAYGRADRLSQFYGYDNSSFIKALESRGFYVAERSGANYNQTQQCLATSLNMTYISIEKQKIPDAETLRGMIDKNAVSDALRGHGYQYVQIWSGHEESRGGSADVILNNEPELSAFEGQAVGLSAAGASALTQHDLYDTHRKHFMGVFSALTTAAQLPYPKFVFAHVLSPHPPFVFNSDGSAIDPNGEYNLNDGSYLLKSISRDQYKTGYVNQLKYVNQKTLEALDSILKLSRRPPIVIIQGDHGSRMNLDWDSVAKTDLREPFSILNAYLVPKKMEKRLYSTITPVNTFRILLSSVFNENHPLLPDRNFFCSPAFPDSVLEVTAAINKKPGEQTAVVPSGSAFAPQEMNKKSFSHSVE